MPSQTLHVQEDSDDIGEEEESFSNESENNTSIGDENTIFYEASTSSLEECSKDNEGRENLMSEITYIAPSEDTFITHNIIPRRWF